MNPTVKRAAIAASVIIAAILVYRYWKAKQAPAPAETTL